MPKFCFEIRVETKFTAPAVIELGCLVWFAVFVPNDNVCVLLCFPASLCEY